VTWDYGLFFWIDQLILMKQKIFWIDFQQNVIWGLTGFCTALFIII